MTEESIASAISGVKGEEQQSQPITIKIGGQEMTFETREDLEQYINNIQNIVQAAAKEALGASQAHYAPQQPGARYTAEELAKDPLQQQAEKLDLEKYAQMLKEDPVKAHAYVNRVIFGGVDPVAVVRELVGRQLALENYLSVQQFLQAHPEYVSTPENDRKLLEIINFNRLPFGYQSLELAYTYAKDRGLLSESRQQTSQSGGGFSQTQNSQIAATRQSSQTSATMSPQTPPPVGRSASTSDFEVPYLEEVEQLDADKILELVKRLERGG